MRYIILSLLLISFLHADDYANHVNGIRNDYIKYDKNLNNLLRKGHFKPGGKYYRPFVWGKDKDNITRYSSPKNHKIVKDSYSRTITFESNAFHSTGANNAGLKGQHFHIQRALVEVDVKTTECFAAKDRGIARSLVKIKNNSKTTDVYNIYTKTENKFHKLDLITEKLDFKVTKKDSLTAIHKKFFRDEFSQVDRGALRDGDDYKPRRYKDKAGSRKLNNTYFPDYYVESTSVLKKGAVKATTYKLRGNIAVMYPATAEEINKYGIATVNPVGANTRSWRELDDIKAVGGGAKRNKVNLYFYAMNGTYYKTEKDINDNTVFVIRNGKKVKVATEGDVGKTVALHMKLKDNTRVYGVNDIASIVETMRKTTGNNEEINNLTMSGHGNKNLLLAMKTKTGTEKEEADSWVGIRDTEAKGFGEKVSNALATGAAVNIFACKVGSGKAPENFITGVGIGVNEKNIKVRASKSICVESFFGTDPYVGPWSLAYQLATPATIESENDDFFEFSVIGGAVKSNKFTAYTNAITEIK